jgi:hypothetical protein
MRQSTSVSSLARALFLAASVSMVASATHAQCRPLNRDPRDRPDTIPAARVILIAPSEAYEPAQLACYLSGRPLVTIFVTDGTATTQLASRLQAVVGGSVVSFARGGRSAPLFASALVDSVVIKTGRRNLDKALVIVAEPELFKPILESALGERARTLELEPDLRVLVLGVRANSCCTLTVPQP